MSVVIITFTDENQVIGEMIDSSEKSLAIKNPLILTTKFENNTPTFTLYPYSIYSFKEVFNKEHIRSVCLEPITSIVSNYIAIIEQSIMQSETTETIEFNDDESEEHEGGNVIDFRSNKVTIH